MSQEIYYNIKFLYNIIKGKKILLVRTNSFDKLNIDNLFKDSEVTEFLNFTPNPQYEQIVKGVEIFKKNQVDLIVAVGGGSAIDVAKCIKLFCKMNLEISFLDQEKENSEIPLIAIPTTAGSGSESTRYAAIYYKGKKQSITHDSILPNVVILESLLLQTLPTYQKKVSMLDALSQGIESIWSIKSTDESRDYGIKAIELIRDNWDSYLNCEDEFASFNILLAANYSGKAINISETTAAHALSYNLTSTFNIAHGHAVALCLSSIWKLMILNKANCIDSRGVEYFKNILNNIPVSVDWYDDLLNQLKLEIEVSEDYSIRIKKMAETINIERLANSPVEITVKEIELIYKEILSGSKKIY